MRVINRLWAKSISCSVLALASAASTTSMDARAQSSSAAATVATADRVEFNIAAGTTGEALNRFAQQAKVQLLFNYDLVRGTQSPEVRGVLSRQQALERLLAGSRLEVASVSDTTIVLKERSGAVVRPVGDPEPAPIVEVIVTGTHIRGAAPTSPARTVTRQEIERNGFATTTDLVKSLPEVFTGGQNPGVMQNPISSNNNLFNSSTVNLRGIGSDATLVLVNGKRLATESQFGGIDISGVPLGALERVEIVTDGSSALYGSDAVAGVVNFITRKNVDGLEATARLGDSTQGGGFQQGYSLLGGRTWTGGHVLVNLDWGRQEELLVSEREITQSAPAFNNLIRPSERKSLFISGEHAVSDRLRLTVDGLYSAHDAMARSRNTLSSNPFAVHPKVITYVVAPGVEFDIAGDWTLSLDASYARGQGSYVTHFPIANTRSMVQNHSNTGAIEIKGNGTLLTTAAGPVRVAVGGGLRREDYERRATTSTYVASSEREVTYGYAEVFAPLVSASAERVGLNALDLSLSGRFEDYDQFGETSTYKVGLRYVPVAGLSLRATKGTSFKAPTMFQVSASQSASLYTAATFGLTTPGAVLITNGGNPNLEPETSTNWTAGFDWTSRHDRPWRLSATWFDIDYGDRVVQPVTPFNQAITNPIFAPFVVQSPSAAFQSDIMSEVLQVFNNTGTAYNPSNVLAYVENRSFNASAQHIYGLDVSVRKRFDFTWGAIEAFGNATDLTIDQTTVPGAPETQVSGVLFAAPERRARGGASLVWEQVTLTGMANYVSGSIDTYVTPNRDVASWTTLDLNLSYRPDWTGWGRDVEAGLSITNALDKRPPYARGGGISLNGSYFDSANTSAIGRFITLTLKKRL